MCLHLSNQIHDLNSIINFKRTIVSSSIIKKFNPDRISDPNDNYNTSTTCCYWPTICQRPFGRLTLIRIWHALYGWKKRWTSWTSCLTPKQGRYWDMTPPSSLETSTFLLWCSYTLCLIRNQLFLWLFSFMIESFRRSRSVSLGSC